MDDKVIQWELRPCEKCGRSDPESRTYAPEIVQRAGETSRWTRMIATCRCGHKFNVWTATMDAPQPAMRHGVIRNVEVS